MPVRIFAIIALVILAVTISLWSPLIASLFDWTGSNSSFLQGLDSLLQIVLLLGAGVLGFLTWMAQRKRTISRDDNEPGEGDRISTGDISNSTVFVGNDNTVMQPPQPPSFREIITTYYHTLKKECNRLPLGIVDPRFSGSDDQIPLASVYTDLDVVARPRKEGEKGREWMLRLARDSDGERGPLLTALSERESARVVVLGDPGSGKTTFVHYLARQLALISLGGNPSKDLPESFVGLLPLRLVLRELGPHLPDNNSCGTAELLWDGIQRELKKNGVGADQLEAGFPALRDHLRERGFFLLDGLDEAPEAGGRRRCLLQSIQAFSDTLGPSARVLVTARPYAYGGEHYLAGFSQLTLAALNRNQMNGFVENWYRAMMPLMSWQEPAALERGNKLKTTFNERDYLADLGSRPLLLTLICSLHSSNSKLPEDRADLYEESVLLLLHRWQSRLDEPDETGARLLDKETIEALNDVEVLRSGLERLAFVTHERQGVQEQRDDAPADIEDETILGILAKVLPEEGGNSKGLLRFLDRRAGLLTGRGDGTYAFVHRSFQEYLAACHLAETAVDLAVDLKELLHRDQQWWREVALLIVGKRRQGGMGVALGLLNDLLVEAACKVEDEEFYYRLAALVGMGLLDLRAAERAGTHAVYVAVRERARGWLVQMLDQGGLALSERAKAAEVLGRLGDLRPGVGLGRDNLPDIDWMEMEVGSFTMGSDDDLDYEKSAHQLKLPAFSISRYPVTNVQYGAFVKAGGYTEQRWWSKEGLNWLQGKDSDLSLIDDADLRKSYEAHLQFRPVERRQEPFYWNESRWNGRNQPVVGICWYEAMAFSAWLDVELRQQRPELFAQGMALRLPTEAEWERAARGTDGRRYPWGEDWQAGQANTEEAGLKETSPVGLFASSQGESIPADMVGNSWEWCHSRWGTDPSKPEYGYPYDDQRYRERELASGLSWRIVRGGSWYDDKDTARCAYRYRDIPDDYDLYIGCRVVLSLAIPES